MRIEHPDDAQQFEQAILEVGALPVYERNREVVAVRFDTLLKIAERWGYLQADPAGIVKELQHLAPASEELADLLKKDIGKLRWEDVRRALNGLGAKAVADGAGQRTEGIAAVGISVRVSFPSPASGRREILNQPAIVIFLPPARAEAKIASITRMSASPSSPGARNGVPCMIASASSSICSAC